MDYRVISIGTLSRHELWAKPVPPRTAHATTTLIRSGKQCILVDPGLPAQIIAARLQERAGIDCSEITAVFLTCFRPAHRIGLDAFPDAHWWINEQERQIVGSGLIGQLEREQEPELKRILKQETAILKNCRAAPDQLAEHVDLFPSPGFTPGTCGLLLSHLNSTTLIAGDAVCTAEHLAQGRVLRSCYDAEQARQSLVEAVEIADVIVPGHDNVQVNPIRGGL
jgi:glyoxylase-like metal-dependent hydrolase (beta-lactamase superfamily II)